MTPQPEPDQDARRISGEPIAWTSPDGVKHMSDVMMEKFALEMAKKDAEIARLNNIISVTSRFCRVLICLTCGEHYADGYQRECGHSYETDAKETK